MESPSPWKDNLWIPVAAPPKRKSFTEEDLACLDDEYFEPDPWSEDEDEDLSDYERVVSPEEITQAEKVWRIREGNIDFAPKCIHIMLRREENKEEHVKISIDLYYLIVIKRWDDKIRKRKEKDMRSANVEEGLQNLNIQDEEENEEDQLWIPVADPPKLKPFTEEDLACLDDEYFEPDPWSDDENEDLFDYERVVSPEEITQAAKFWRIREGNVDLDPKCIHIMWRREENKEEYVKISIDLYYLIVLERMDDKRRKRKEKEMRSANVQEGLKNLNIQDEEEKEKVEVIFRSVFLFLNHHHYFVLFGFRHIFCGALFAIKSYYKKR
ncbi:hypothetical protein RHMOL_Rhmol03G0192900 [Rhododendron molle]|uniref:Uncharacterized protein n=1 Tax=Rhododendron molle TaxID=49168 RepID=A0ACC0PHI6_RHOML|nr:hypothetical protein RHMOL_Rhmol03G0192900 [Rhododendron molle]